MENQLEFTYNKKITLQTLIAPAVGLAAIVYTFYDKVDVAFKNFVILPYPYSEYFIRGIGVLLILSFIATLMLSRKKRVVSLGVNSLDFTKGSFTSKEVSWNYKDISSLKMEEDEDDGRYLDVVAFQGKSNGTFEEFYEHNFESKMDFESFYKILTDKIIEVSQIK